MDRSIQDWIRDDLEAFSSFFIDPQSNASHLYEQHIQINLNVHAACRDYQRFQLNAFFLTTRL